MNKKKMMVFIAPIVASITMVALPSGAAETKAALPTSTNVTTNYTPIAEARAKIGDIIADSSLMTEVLKTLSPEDQKTFLADVNAAIAKLPGSTEDRTAKYLNINRAAYKGAAEGNMANLVAVTFASVPPESLVVLSERYAVDLFNRDADPTQKFTDAAFEKTAHDVVSKVEQATAGSDDAGVRNTLAILMFVRSSNGSPADLSDKLVATMPDATTRELAKTEWIPAAMAEGDKKSYDGMLAYADANKCPSLNIVLDLAGPQILDAMLIDITSSMLNKSGDSTTPILDQAFGGFSEDRTLMLQDTTDIDAFGSARPLTTDPTKKWNPNYTRDNASEKVEEAKPKPEPGPGPGPGPYPYTVM